MIWEILLLLTFVIYSITEGATHAVLWSKTGAEAFKWDEHILFNIQKVCIGFMPLLGLAVGTLTSVVAIALIGGVMYPFWHNGFYYWFRNMISVSSEKMYADKYPIYPKKFIDFSTTSTAAINFTWIVRLSMFLGALLLFIYLFMIR